MHTENPKSKPSIIKQLLVYVFLSYILSWSFFIPAVHSSNLQSFGDQSFVLILIGSFGPTFAALISYFWFNGRQETMAWLKSLLVFKFGWIQFLSITVLPGLVASLLFMLFVEQKSPWYVILLNVAIAMPINGVLGVFSGAGPLGEELGWRGFLTPALLKKYNKYTTAFIVGLVWSLWHLPLMFVAEFRSGLDFIVYLPLYVLGTFAFAFAFIPLSKITKSSIFAAIILHSVINTLAAQIFGGQLFVFDQKLSIFNIALFSPIFFVVYAFLLTKIAGTKKLQNKI